MNTNRLIILLAAIIVAVPVCGETMLACGVPLATVLAAANSLVLVGMAVSATYGVALTIGSVSIQKTINRSADNAISHEVTLPVGTAGTLTTRTDDDTGVITVASHSLIVGDKVDVYWSGGMRYGMTVSAQTATTITVGTGAGEVGAGDVFPAATTAVVITEQVSIVTSIDGDNAKLVGIVAEYPSSSSTAVAHVDFRDSGGSTIEEIDLVANAPQIWDITGGASNVFTGNPITVCKASNGSSSEVATLKFGALQTSAS